MSSHNLSCQEFMKWAESARAGDSITYHLGSLNNDRTYAHNDVELTESIRIDAVANTAWKLREIGLVYLFSEKLTSSHYRYIAIRSSRTFLAKGHYQ